MYSLRCIALAPAKVKLTLGLRLYLDAHKLVQDKLFTKDKLNLGSLLLH